MIDQPKIVHTEAQPAAVIHVTVAKDKIREVMGPGLKELRDTLAAQGIQPTSPWFTRHLTLEPSQWDFEIGLPISAPIKPQGRVKAGELPAADYPSRRRHDATLPRFVPRGSERR